MKRMTPLFVLAFFTCFHLMAQKALVDWSEVDKRSVWGPYLSNIAKGHGDEVITLGVKGSGLLGGKQTPTFTRYDRHWNPVLEKDPFNGSPPCHSTNTSAILAATSLKSSRSSPTRRWPSMKAVAGSSNV